MSKTTDQLVLELKIKREARKQLREAKRLLKEDGGVMEAFKDVFRALRLAAMDLSNSLRLVVASVITFDPEKLKKKMKEFDDRRQKINNEWAPIMQRAEDAIGGADPILKMAVLGPANFFALQGIGASLTAGKTVAEIVTATKFDELINSYTVELDLNQGLQRFYKNWTDSEEKKQAAEYQSTGSGSGGKAGGGGGGKGTGLLNRLSNIFSESSYVEGSMLSEKKEDKEKKKPEAPKLSEDEAIQMFIQATGMEKRFEELRKEQMKNLKSTIEDLLKEIEPARSTSQLFAASNMKQLEQAFAEAKRQNPKLDETAYEKFNKTVTEKSQELMKDKAFVDKLKKQLKKEELTPEELKASTEETVFNGAKSEFDKSTYEGLKKVVDASGSSIEDLKIDEKTLDTMKKSSYDDSKEVAKIYENLLKVYKEIKQDFETKAKPKAR